MNRLQRKIYLLLFFISLLLHTGNIVYGFDYFEHRYLGDAAYQRALIKEYRLEISKSSSKKNSDRKKIIFEYLKVFPEQLWVNQDDSQDGKINCERFHYRDDIDVRLACHFLRQVPLTFGDLPALAGDHTGNAEKLETMLVDPEGVSNHFLTSESARIIATRRQWFNACKWFREENRFPVALADQGNLSLEERLTRAEREISSLRYVLLSNKGEHSLPVDIANCFNSEMRGNKLTGLAYPMAQQTKEKPYKNDTLGGSGYSPSREELSDFEKLPNYLDLVEHNRRHFPKFSWKTYLVFHRRAILDAEKFFENTKNTSNFNTTELIILHSALINEGFAQHFLHDSFSSGHIGTQFGICLHERKPFGFVPLDWLVTFTPLPPLFCHPPKVLLQHTHDSLNALGVRVKSTTPQDLEWVSYGDQHLFIPEGSANRTMIIKAATLSIMEVFSAMVKEGSSHNSNSEETKECKGLEDEMYPDDRGNLERLCHDWIGYFPKPSPESFLKMEPAQKDDEKEKPFQDLVYFRGSSPRFGPKELWDFFEYKGTPPPLVPNSVWEFFDMDAGWGRTTDPRVPDIPFDGWKLSVTWGPIWGNLDELAPRRPRNSSTSGSFELGYMRPTDGWINYIGVGMFILPGTRTSLYPISVGYWWAPPSRKFFIGTRVNLGVRIIERFQEENPRNRIRTPVELSMPFDLGYSIYPPVSLYMRAELLTAVFNGLNESGPITNIRLDSLLIGRGSLTFGLSMDLAGIL